MTLCLAPLASAQNPPGSNPVLVAAGRAISLGFLSELTNPARTKYQAGIVLGNGCYGMLVSPKGAPSAVAYIEGKKDSVCVQAVRQVANPDATASGFHIIRKTIDSGKCPGLTAAIIEFYSVLETDLSNPVSLAGPPPPNSTRRIVTDSANFLVRLATTDATLSLKPLGHFQPPLQLALGQLFQVASTCAGGITESVEEHYGFNGEELLR